MPLEAGCWYFGNISVGNYPWATPRGMEGKMEAQWGKIDLFVCDRLGKARGEGVMTVDVDPAWKPHLVADMNALPLEDRAYRFAFWDPPYDRPYGRAWAEVKRVSRELAAGLHYYVLPAGRGWKLAAVMPILSGGPWHKVRVLTVVRRLEGEELAKQTARKDAKRLRRQRERAQAREAIPGTAHQEAFPGLPLHPSVVPQGVMGGQEAPGPTGRPLAFLST